MDFPAKKNKRSNRSQYWLHKGKKPIKLISELLVRGIYDSRDWMPYSNIIYSKAHYSCAFLLVNREEVITDCCTVSAAALQLLKTIDDDHLLPSENQQMLPCCGSISLRRLSREHI